MDDSTQRHACCNPTSWEGHNRPTFQLLFGTGAQLFQLLLGSILAIVRITRGLSDDIRDQLILERGNLILQLELALLESRDLKLVGSGREQERVDRIVQIAMLLPKHADQPNDLRLVHHSTRPPKSPDSVRLLHDSAQGAGTIRMRGTKAFTNNVNRVLIMDRDALVTALD